MPKGEWGLGGSELFTVTRQNLVVIATLGGLLGWMVFYLRLGSLGRSTMSS